MPEPPAEPGHGLTGPWWTRTEAAWGAGLAAGFLATWVGLALPVAGAAAVLATGAFGPLWIGLLRRERRVLACAVALSWALGILAATAGVVHEAAQPGSLHDRVPGARAFVEGELAFLAGSGADDVGAGLGALAATELLVAGLIAALGRPLAGVAGLLLAALASAAVGAGIGSAGFPPEASGLLVLAHVPPHLALLVAGGLAGAAALAEEEPLAPWAPLSPPRRRLLAAALALGVVAMLGRSTLVGLWREGLAGSLESLANSH